MKVQWKRPGSLALRNKEKEGRKDRHQNRMQHSIGLKTPTQKLFDKGNEKYILALMLWKMEFKLFYTREIRNQVYHKNTQKMIFETNLVYVDIEIATCFALVESFKAKFFSKNPVQWYVSCKPDFRPLPWKKFLSISFTEFLLSIHVFFWRWTLL